MDVSVPRGPFKKIHFRSTVCTRLTVHKWNGMRNVRWVLWQMGWWQQYLIGEMALTLTVDSSILKCFARYSSANQSFFITVLYWRMDTFLVLCVCGYKYLHQWKMWNVFLCTMLSLFRIKRVTWKRLHVVWKNEPRSCAPWTAVKCHERDAPF